MAKCPRCLNTGPGFMRMCSRCKNELAIMSGKPHVVDPSKEEEE